MSSRTFLWVVAVAAAAPAGPAAARPWLAPGPIADRVASLLAAMTLEEKVAQLNYDCPTRLVYSEQYFAATGTGTVGIECSGLAPNSSDMASRIASLRVFQEDALRVSRLGIPVTFSIETSHCGAAGGTIFPMGVTQGATWNASLVGDIARAIALEARSWGGDRGLSPEINVVTDPRFGRTEENFGEDGFHVATMATAAVIGLQGAGMPDEYLQDPTSSIVAEAKHCCVYGFSGLDGGAADVSEKTLHDVYLKPWKAFVAAGGRGMMMSHNNLNAVPMHANAAIMSGLFRSRLNYSGFFASDMGNIGALVRTRTAANETAAAALALAAGMDQAFCDSAFSAGTLVPAVTAGTVPLADIDRAAGKILQAKFAAGLFDGALPDPARRALIYSDAHRALARQAAAEGAVLLTNVNNTLPLDLTKLRRIAILGPASGCGIPTAPAEQRHSGECTLAPDSDCNGDDLLKVDNVTTTTACCALCAANPLCVVAVLATGEPKQCLLKSACSMPQHMPERIMCGSPPPVDATPWSCMAQRSMLGGYSNLERTTDATGDNHAHVVTVLEAALAAAAASGGALNVSWASGVDLTGTDMSGIAPAAALAAAADVAILVLGDGGEAVGYNSAVSCGEGADRPSLDIPGVQLALLAAVVATGTPTVVVLVHGRPVTFGGDYGGAAVSIFTDGGALPLDERAGAVLAAWRPGCEGGAALWDLLTGVVSPSGRLPQAWPYSVGGVRVAGISPQQVLFTDQGGSGWTLGAKFAPAYALGHGLDFLSVAFTSSAAVVDVASQCINVSVSVANAAPRAGGYVVEVFFSQQLSRYARYERMLGGWAKVTLPPRGESDVLIPIPFSVLEHWDPAAAGGAGAMIREAGNYAVSVCTSAVACAPEHTHAVVVPGA